VADRATIPTDHTLPARRRTAS